jgi:type III pantothenate kinase
LFDSEHIVESFYLESGIPGRENHDRLIEEIGLKVKHFLQLKRRQTEDVTGVAICSVVCGLSEVWMEIAAKFFGVRAWQLSPEADIGLEIKVENRSAVGPDRLANAVAARSLYGQPAIVVDMGTATNFEVVDRKGAFVGGAIAPGVQAAAAELFRRASRLSPVDIEKPSQFINSDTAGALQSGIYYGALGQVDYIIAGMIKELGAKDVKVIGTGGYIRKFAPFSQYISIVDMHLTLTGIYLVYKRNNK